MDQVFRGSNSPIGTTPVHRRECPQTFTLSHTYAAVCKQTADLADSCARPGKCPPPPAGRVRERVANQALIARLAELRAKVYP
eukprot:963071-Rhodomonas_salina.3